MNTTKVNAVIGFTIVLVAGVVLLLQGDSSLMLSDGSMAMIAGFVFMSILLGMIYWRRNAQQTPPERRRHRGKRR